MGDKVSLGQFPLFSTLPASEMEVLSEALRPCLFQSGDTLIRQDDPGESYFVVLEGDVEIVKSHGTPDERLLGVRSAGAFLGEMSLFTGDGRHTASVIAKTPVKALEMSHAELDALLHRHPSFAYEIIRTLSRRLDESENQTISDLREKNQALEQALQDLRAAQVELVEKERLERELEVAREIQRSILPTELPRFGRAQFGARLESMTAVGGDFYDVMVLDDRRFALVVGDVSDHGVPAALMMAQTATLVRVLGQGQRSPGETLRELNNYLVDRNQAGMFVTVLIAVYDAGQGELRYARAGHEPPLIFNRNSVELKPDLGVGQPLGLFDQVQIDEQRLDLESGSLIVGFTDGVTEQSAPSGEFFGRGRLRDAISEAASRHPQMVCDQVFAYLGDFRRGSPTLDDITIAAMRVGEEDGD